MVISLSRENNSPLVYGSNSSGIAAVPTKPESSTPATSRRHARKSIPIKGIAAALGFVLLATVGFGIWRQLSRFQETDDAYVTAHVTPISSRVESNVDEVLIDDNEHVQKGQLLMILDPRDYQQKVDAARTELERVRAASLVAHRSAALSAMNAQASHLNASGDVSGSQSEIARARVAVRAAQFALEEQQQNLAGKQAEFSRAALDYKRFAKLESEGAISTSERDSARRDFDVAKAAVDATERAIDRNSALIEEATNQMKVAMAKNVQSQGNLRTAQASDIQTQVSRLQDQVSSAAIKESEAKLQNALLQLSYCRIYAPVSGRVGRKTVELGQRVQPGGRLFTLTEDDIWVVANFKESQLEKMHVGQAVEVSVDVIASHKFKGVVDSFSPGTGAQFTLLPPDNATGNFTKIVQRVPVKVRFTESVGEFHDKLVPGLSATVSVKVDQDEKS